MVNGCMTFHEMPVWALMVLYGQCTTKVLGYKPVPVALYPPQTPHGLT